MARAKIVKKPYRWREILARTAKARAKLDAIIAKAPKDSKLDRLLVITKGLKR